MTAGLPPAARAGAAPADSAARAPAPRAAADSVRALPTPAATPAVPDSARAQATPAGPDSATTPAEPDTARAKRTAPGKLTGWDTPSIVMLQSLVIPGGGQFHNKAYWKAAAIGATETTLLVRLVNDHRDLETLNQDIDAARQAGNAALEQALVIEYNTRSDKYTARQWWFGALLAYSLLDAYIDAHFRNFHVGLTDDPALPPEDRGAAGLKLSWQEHF